MSKKRETRDAFNVKNRYWHKELSEPETEAAVKTMQYMGCPSRGSFLAIAIKLANRIYGPPQTTEAL